MLSDRSEHRHPTEKVRPAPDRLDQIRLRLRTFGSSLFWRLQCDPSFSRLGFRERHSPSPDKRLFDCLQFLHGIGLGTRFELEAMIQKGAIKIELPTQGSWDFDGNRIDFQR